MLWVHTVVIAKLNALITSLDFAASAVRALMEMDVYAWRKVRLIFFKLWKLMVLMHPLEGPLGVRSYIIA